MSAWEWPQWYMATMTSVAVIFAVMLNGRPRTGEYNGAVSLILVAIEIFALYSGGFWK